MLGTTVISASQDDQNTGMKVKHSEGSGMEIDQAGQLNALLNESTKVLNKNQEPKGIDSSTTKRRQ